MSESRAIAFLTSTCLLSMYWLIYLPSEKKSDISCQVWKYLYWFTVKGACARVEWLQWPSIRLSHLCIQAFPVTQMRFHFSFQLSTIIHLFGWRHFWQFSVKLLIRQKGWALSWAINQTRAPSFSGGCCKIITHLQPSFKRYYCR